MSVQADLRSTAAPSKRRQTGTPRRAPRRPTTPAATAGLASAVGADLTNWTSEGYDSLTLRAPEPVVGYDELTVPEVQAQLTAGDEARAASVREYERSHKQRDGVLHAAQARIDKG